MNQSQFCYKHKDESSRKIDTEHISTLEPIGGYFAKEQVPPELLKFAEHLSSAGKTVYDVFSGMDLNEDGTLDVSEFREGLAALEKNLWWTEAGEIESLTPSAIDSLVDAFDRSGDGKIDLTEFNDVLMRIPGYGVDYGGVGLGNKGVLLAAALNLIWLIVLGDAAGELLGVFGERGPGSNIFGFVACLALFWPALAVFAYMAHKDRANVRLIPVESPTPTLTPEEIAEKEEWQQRVVAKESAEQLARPPVLGATCLHSLCLKTSMNTSHYCYRHKDESGREDEDVKRAEFIESVSTDGEVDMDKINRQVDKEFRIIFLIIGLLAAVKFLT
jgi:hypothetical protein